MRLRRPTPIARYRLAPVIAQLLSLLAVLLGFVAASVPAHLTYASPEVARTTVTTATSIITRTSAFRGYDDHRSVLRVRAGIAGRLLATKGGRAPASSAVSGRLLKRQLASESQMAGRGSPIFGSGTNRPLHEAPRLARTYGGRAQDYAKMGSSGTSRDGGGLYDLFETHWYQNLRTGQRFEPKTKFPRAEDFFRGGGGG